MNLSEILLCRAKLFHHRQVLSDIGQKVTDELRPIGPSIKPGMSIAVAVGSRGIANIAVIVKAAVDFLKGCGARPFIVPAMGSHGGATAEGQAQVLAGYGVTEEYLGAPVKSSMAAVQIANADAPENVPVFMDKFAYESDGVIVINRVKSHTDFHGPVESGIIKMLVIGLGKHKQALAIHKFGVHGLKNLIAPAAEKVLESGKIMGGIAILEDGYENTADIAFAAPSGFFALDAAFLKRSKEYMARLPFENIDALFVDYLGKDISGSGMDTNIIGRLRLMGEADFPPHIKHIILGDLTPASHGNALGIGLSDIITRRLADKIDWPATYANVITSGFLERGFMPIVCENDRQALSVALQASGAETEDTIKIARIKDTLHLDEVYLSRPLMDELLLSGKGEQISDFRPICFENGDFAPF